MSRMLNQQCTLAKLRAEIEDREERVYQRYKRFGYLAHNYRNKKKKEKRKSISQNKFEVIASRVMQCGVRKEVKVKRQETIEKVKCFRYWGIGHLKWECPNIEVKKKKKKEEEVVHVARLQKAQQQGRLVYPIQEKVQEYCEKWNMPPEGVILLKRGQITRETVVTYIDCGGYKSKGVQICKNQE